MATATCVLGDRAGAMVVSSMRTRAPRGPVTRLIMLIAAIGLFVAGYYWGNLHQFSGDPPVIQGVLVRPPVALPDFGLKDVRARPFDRDALEGRWTLIAFGDLRQAQGHLAVNRLIGVFNRLADQPELRAKLQLALASEAQAPALARDFARLSPALLLVSGDAEDLQRLRAAVGDLARDGTTPDNETSPLFLIDPKTRLMALFPAAQAPDTIAADLSALSARPDLLDTFPNE